MAIARVNYAYTQRTTNGASVVVNVPTSTADGNVMLAFLAVQSATAVAMNTPTGWTYLGVAGNPPTGQARVWCFWKLASSEPTNYTFTWDTNVLMLGFILTYSGNHATSPIRASVSNTGTGTAFGGTTATLGTVSATKDDMLVAAWQGGANNPHTASGSPTMSTWFEDNGTNWDTAFWGSDVTIVTTGTTTAYTNTDPNGWANWAVAIKPPDPVVANFIITD